MPATDVERKLLEAPGGFVASCRPSDLVYFVLNVGDGDTQLLLLPEDSKGRRRCVVVDCIQAKKLFALLESLADEEKGLLKEVDQLLALVVATHPHDDHIAGMEALLRTYGRENHIREFWEPGYYHPSAAYLGMMRELEDLDDVLHLQPASGTTRYLGQVKFTVLAPGVVLRNQFDSYGIDINNASIALKVDFPAGRTVERSEKRSFRRPSTQTLILGADAQTRSWGQVLVDFPQLGPHNTEVTRALRGAGGYEPLVADVFKVPHHGSKHGLNLELVEQVMPAVSIISSVHDAGRYGFPHAVTQAALREALHPISSMPFGTPQKDDSELGILYTSSAEQQKGKADPDKPLGTIAVVIGASGRREIWRFRDAQDKHIDLAAGQRMKAVGPAETAHAAAEA